METITIHIPDWFLILIAVWLGIAAAESTLKLISWVLTKKLERRVKKEWKEDTNLKHPLIHEEE